MIGATPRIAAILVALVVLSALSVVKTRHEARKLFQVLQAEQKRGRELEVQWESFLTEQSSWGMHGRVEQMVQQHMRMKVPEPSRVRVIEPAPPEVAR